jgi:hypothetical protein
MTYARRLSTLRAASSMCRHTAHALRVIIDAHGAYSIVDGVATPMETGDVLLTPGGAGTNMGITVTRRPIGAASPGEDPCEPPSRLPQLHLCRR